MKRRGFTIVELMMVVGIIAVLLTFVTTSVTGSIRNGRVARGNALRTLVKQGICTYYAQKGEWPWKSDKTPNDTKGEYYEFSGDEVKSMIFELVKESKQNNNPMMDISGLFVSISNGEHGKAYGMDFMTAVKGSKSHPEKRKASELYYGYPEKTHGYFRRFKIRYYPATDTITVDKLNNND